MTQPAMDPLAALLYQIAQAEPQPWYPKTFAEARGVPRDSLDVPLERLRMLGLIELTEWVANQGQGYRVTGAGKRVLYDRGLMAKLLAGNLAPAQPEPEASPEGSWSGRDPNPLERGEAIRAGLMSKARPIVTYVLIFLNVAVFLFGLALAVHLKIPLTAVLVGFDPQNDIPEITGAVSGEYLRAGEWWRLIAAFWVHIGVLHLGMNMYSLWVLGPISEKMWGRWRFLALYLISGLGGNCVVALFSSTGAAGASGAIWGVMTSFLVWVYLNKSALPPNLASSWLRSVGYCLFLNVMITFFIPGISMAGHFGGGGFGAAAALLLNTQRFSSGLNRLAATLAVFLLPVVAIAGVIYLPKAQEKPNEDISSFAGLIKVGEAAFDQAAKAYNASVLPVLEKPVDQREPEEIATALKTLATQQDKINQTARLLERFGKSDDPFEEEARQALISCLRHRSDMFKLTASKVEKGKGWDAKDEKSLREQKQALNEAVARFNAATAKPKE